MVEVYKYYYVLYLIDSNDQTTFISNTDPIIYNDNIENAKLYDDEVNVDNDILLYYERMHYLVRNTDVEGFYKGYIRIDSNNNIEMLLSNKIF